MDYSTIRFSRQGPAAIVQLNRPAKRNAINFDMMHEIENVLAATNDDPEIRAIIFTGGTDYFSSGVDLNAMRDKGAPSDFMDYMKHWRVINRAMEEHNKVTIAAIEGFCMTGGLEFALACDLRIGAKGSSYTITSSKIGTVPGAGGTQRLPRIIGIPNSLEFLLSADPVDADWAYRTGLINRLTEKGAALEAATAFAQTMEQRAPLSIRFMKRAIYGGMQMPLDQAIEYEGFMVNTIYNSADKLEGITAFLEKRPARFIGN